MTTERKVADTILEETFPVSIAGKKYNVSRLRYRNYITLSALSAESGRTTDKELEVFEAIQDKEKDLNDKFNKENVSVLLNFVFKEGLSAEKQAEMLSVMVFNFKKPKSFLEKSIQKAKIHSLKNKILNLSASDFSVLKIQLFNQLEYVDFFLNTVSLREINILKETVTTASGQQ